MPRPLLPRLFLVALAALAAAGCQTLEDKRKIDYRATRTLPELQVPADLSKPPPLGAAGKEQPGAGTRFSEYADGQPRPGPVAGSVVLPTYTDIQVLRDDRSRWLAVNGSAEALWPRVREFVLATGLLIDKENPATGVIETDWAENRARVGTGGQMLLAKWLGSFYSTGTRDKYRIRLERGAQPDTTEIYLTHQGMEEVLVSVSSDTEGTRWQSRPADPELEAEMLRRLLVRLGTEEKRAEALVAVTPKQDRAQLIRSGEGAGTLEVQESFDRAWRRVGLALDRVGFTVEDRDRSKGLYYVRYVDPEADARSKKDDEGLLSKLLFWRGSKQAVSKTQYRVYVKEAGSSASAVQVLTAEGGVDRSETAGRILALLHEQLK